MNKQKTLFLLLIFPVILCGQQEQKALTIGEKFPEYLLNELNRDQIYPLTPANLKGKIIIIDLWNVHCLGCIASMNKMDSLQKNFSSELQIILVTKDKDEEVKKLFLNHKVKRPALPMINGDDLFYDVLFPHDGDPLHVWLDPNLKIRYITPGYNLSFENIQKVINGKKLDVSVQSKLADFDGARPLIEEAANRLSYYREQYSLIMKGIYEQVNSSGIEVKKDPITKKSFSIKAINASVLTLYQLAYIRDVFGLELNVNALMLHKNNRLILQTKSAKELVAPSEIEALDAWKKKNVFCYELVVPKEMSDKLYKNMQQDLNRYFNVNAKIEKRKARCLVLRDKNVPKKKGTDHFSDEQKELRSDFIKQLTYLTQRFNMPLVDESSYAINPNLNLPDAIENADGLAKLLNEYGFDLVVEERMINMLVIK